MTGTTGTTTWVAAAHPSFQQPHTVIFFVLTLAAVAIAVAATFANWEIGRQRQVYWGATAAAALCGFSAALPNVTDGIAIGLFAVFAMTLPAYFSGSLIKIGGKVIAFHIRDSQPDADHRPEQRASGGTHARSSGSGELDTSYGGSVTAPKAWWLTVICVGLCSWTVVGLIDGTAKPIIAILAGGALVVMALLFGAGDSSWGFAIARGQYLQLAIITVISAGMFTIAYLVAFAICRKKPIRKAASSEANKHSRQRRASP